MRHILIACVFLLASHARLATASDLPPAIEADKGFMACYASLADMVKADKRYKRIPLDSEAQANDFVVQLHDLYTGRSTDVAFYAWMAMHYPGHEYEQVVVYEHMSRCKR